MDNKYGKLGLPQTEIALQDYDKFWTYGNATIIYVPVHFAFVE